MNMNPNQAQARQRTFEPLVTRRRCMNPHIKTGIFILCLSLFAVASLRAQANEVPINIQVVLFKKIFMFDKALQGKPQVNVLVIYTDASEESKDEIVAAFQQAGCTTSAVRVEQAGGKMGEASVVYLAKGAGSAKVQCAKAGVLSISGVASLIEGGSVAVGVGTESGKPKIFVSVSTLKAAGHELSADLLNIAHIMQ